VGSHPSSLTTSSLMNSAGSLASHRGPTILWLVFGSGFVATLPCLGEFALRMTGRVRTGGVRTPSDPTADEIHGVFETNRIVALFNALLLVRAREIGLIAPRSVGKSSSMVCAESDASRRRNRAGTRRTARGARLRTTGGALWLCPVRWTERENRFQATGRPTS
jgi:hypothetical protein